MIELLSWRGGQEAALRLGVGSPVKAIVIPALFEEANRMRRFTVSVMRALAVRRVETLLPDLPGTAESLQESSSITLADWRDFITDIRGNIMISLSFRGGCLLDSDFAHCWRMAPEAGDRLLRDMVRATALGTDQSVADVEARAREDVTRLAGTVIGPQLFGALTAAQPQGDAFVSNVSGTKLWRSAEPGDDPAYADAIADEIAAWIQTCVGI